MASSIGQRRTRVEIQNPTAAADALGQESVTWSTLWACYGYIRPATGREQPVSGQAVATRMTVVETRHPGAAVAALVTPKSRLLVGARRLNVVWTDNPGQRNKDLLIGCIERVDDGPD